MKGGETNMRHDLIWCIILGVAIGFTFAMLMR